MKISSFLFFNPLMLSLSKQHMEAPRARRIARERSKVSFDATLREKGGFSDFGDRKLSGWPCVETLASRCPKLRQDKARAPIVGGH